MTRLWSWKKAAFAEVFAPRSHPDTVAIVVSEKCPQNINVIVKCLLRTPSIAKIIVSNNNPGIHLSDWLSVRDARLTIIDQPVRRPSHVRFGFALREDDYERFLTMDDDLFLKPSQLEALCTALRTDPTRPHGVVGLQYDSWKGMMYHNVRHRTQNVDVISRVCAFTSAHTEQFWQLMREIGIGPRHPAWTSSYSDDLMLSFSAGKPMTHDVGPYLEYPNSASLVMQHDVSRLRLLLLLQLRSMRPQA